MHLALALFVAAGPHTFSAQTPGNERAEQIAKDSYETRRAMTYLEEAARSIKDAKVRAVVVDMLKNPAPTFMKRWPDRALAKQKLVDAGLVDAGVAVDSLFPRLADVTKSPLSFAAAPGGIPGRHHAHPGGLAVHTAFNLQSARALSVAYHERYGAKLDEDVVVAAPILHDAFKAWTLQFQDDGHQLIQPLVGGTSSHHPFIVAECFERGLPLPLVLAVASAHEPPESEGAKVARFLVAGALLGGKDAVALGLVVRSVDGTYALAKPSPIEASISHLSDHDYVLADPAYAVVNDALDRALSTRKDAPTDEWAQRWWKHKVLATVPGLKLYARYVKDGDAGVAQELSAAGL